MGVSVQLVAYLNGDRIDATEMPHDPWRALAKHPLYETLVLRECGLRASRVTRRGRQFFKHYPDVECAIEHKSESEQHLAMKQALKDRINAAPGWRAEVEHAHAERAWIADVLAIHISGKRLAFEVQLSEQSEDEYIFRSQRYVDDGIGPVWVVPENLDWFRVKLPIIVTGFGKGSNLPETAGALMDLSGYQPIFGSMGLVGTAVDTVLHPSFHWPHGTPQRQLDELARLEEARAQAEAEELERAKQAEEMKRLAAQKAAAAAAEAAARFLGSAMAAGALGVRPVISGRGIWASEVRCMKSAHPMLIWRLTQPTGLNGADASWMPKSENFDNVRAHVDTWLAAAGSGLSKAGTYRLQGPGNRMAFACPLCKDVIKGRWVAALPPDKWTVIAEGSSTSRFQAREVLHRRPQTRSTPVEARPQAAGQPSYISENDFRFIGPKRRPFWMQEARDVKELAEWQAAKDALAARMQAIRDNPRYRASPNGFRFECADCGGEFEDDKEGIHADGECLLPGIQNFN